MKVYCVVEIEKHSFIRFMSFESPGRKSIDLTTLVDKQNRALIRIHAVRDNQRILVKEYDVKHLQPKPAGLPRFRLQGDFDGTGELKISLSVDGTPHSRDSVNMKPYLRRPFRKRLLLLLPALIIFAAIAVFLFRIAVFQPAPGPAAAVPPETRPPAERQQPAEAFPSAAVPVPSPAETPAPAPPPVEAPAAAPPPVPEPAPVPASPLPPVETVQPPADVTPPPEVLYKEPSVILFGPDDPRLSGESRNMLLSMLPMLAEHPEAEVVIEGHCAMSGSEQGREQLSRERALNTAAFLRQSGWNPRREPVIEWHAGRVPVTENPEQQHLNRRVEIKIGIRPE